MKTKIFIAASLLIMSMTAQAQEERKVEAVSKTKQAELLLKNTPEFILGATENTFTDGTSSTTFSTDERVVIRMKKCQMLAIMSCEAGKHATFCAPFDVTLPEGVTAYTAAIDGNVVRLSVVATENGILPAGTPVVIYSENEIDGLTLSGYEKISRDIDPNSVLKGIYFTGHTIAQGNYVLYSQGTPEVEAFYRVGTYNFSGAINRCYLSQGPASEARLSIVIDGEETTIGSIISENDTAADGKFVQNDRVVIVKNGRKYDVTGQVLK